MLQQSLKTGPTPEASREGGGNERGGKTEKERGKAEGSASLMK